MERHGVTYLYDNTKDYFKCNKNSPTTSERRNGRMVGDYVAAFSFRFSLMKLATYCTAVITVEKGYKICEPSV